MTTDAGGAQLTAADMAKDGLETSVNMITVHCKLGKETHNVSISSGATVQDLKEKLQDLTNVLPRGQKLIFKGKVLDAKTRLQDAGLSNGAKLMLIASIGVHQGPGTAARGNTVVTTPVRIEPTKEDNSRFQTYVKRKGRFRIEETRAAISSAAWAATGIISMRDRKQEVIPEEVWETGPSARVLDLGGNCLKTVPNDISCLVNLQKLRLSSNNLRDDQLNWQGLGMLKNLIALSLDNNQLTSIPAEVGLMHELKHLSVAKNLVSHVAEEIGNLSKLEQLDFNTNCLKEIPLSLGQCCNLTEIDFSSNLLKEVPSSLGRISCLKSLHLPFNGIKTFPSEILRGCLELQTLSLHGNQLTIDYLRQLDGWAEFDERRKAKHSKQVDFHLVDSSGGFDEGADSQQWHHW